MISKDLTKVILKKYLRLTPVWFDLRKREIIKDRINIRQWQINMNYLIWKYGTIDKKEQQAFEAWVTLNFKSTFKYDDFTRQLENSKLFSISMFDSVIEENLDNKVTPVLKYFSDVLIAPIFHKDQDRNWFLAAYPDVFEYFNPQINFYANDLQGEQKRVEEHVKRSFDNNERMQKYVLNGKGNQTIFLIRMKDFYHLEMKKKILLAI